MVLAGDLLLGLTSFFPCSVRYLPSDTLRDTLICYTEKRSDVWNCEEMVLSFFFFQWEVAMMHVKALLPCFPERLITDTPQQ